MQVSVDQACCRCTSWQRSQSSRQPTHLIVLQVARACAVRCSAISVCWLLSSLLLVSIALLVLLPFRLGLSALWLLLLLPAARVRSPDLWFAVTLAAGGLVTRIAIFAIGAPCSWCGRGCASAGRAGQGVTHEQAPGIGLAVLPCAICCAALCALCMLAARAGCPAVATSCLSPYSKAHSLTHPNFCSIVK